MDWRAYLSSRSPDIELRAGAGEDELSACEEALGLKLPNDLRELLSQSDGVVDEYGFGLVWLAKSVREENLGFRGNPDFARLYMSFDSVLFFGDAGNGDQFCFPIQAGAVRMPDIFVWDHENDSRRWAAPSLKLYFAWWLTGALKV